MNKDIRGAFTAPTRRALSAVEEGYVSKDTDEMALIERLKRDHRLERVYRFDIGKHTDGYSDLIEGVLGQADIASLCKENLVEYPDNQYRLLRKRPAEVHELDPSWFVLSAGLEAMIDTISRVFLGPGANFLVPIPNFSLFAAFSLRQGARPLFVAQIASVDEEHVQRARQKTCERRNRLCGRLSKLATFSHLPSETNTLMVRNCRLKASALWERLAHRGLLTADLSAVNGLQGQEFLRVTVRAEQENDLLVEACRSIERELP